MTTLGGSSRVVGVDLARGVALLGIMAVHIFPPLQADGSVHPAFLIDSGRSPALFPLLAGVGVALANGGDRLPAGVQLWSARAGLAARAFLLIAVGLLLGRVDSPPLVILVHFGFMFLAATLFLSLRTRALLVIAAVWVVVVPTVSFLVRTGPAGTAGSPQLPGPSSILQPFVDLALTSAYPVLVWTAYLLVGLAIGRSGMAASRRPVQLVMVGTAVSVVGKVSSSLLLGAAGGARSLTGHTEGLRVFAPDMETQLGVGLVGTTPTTDWRWLLVSAAHSSTTFDLLHTGGAAVAVLGVCLLVVRWVGRTGVLPLVAVGSMTLTLYSAHVLALWRDGPLLLEDPFLLYVAHGAVAIVVALLWRSYVGRGPLEAFAAGLDATARAGVSRRSRRSGAPASATRTSRGRSSRDTRKRTSGT